jgi:hypothetical protein
MAWAFMTDPLTNRVALYDEPVPGVTEEDFADPNSACNAPLNDPDGNLQYIYFHSDMDNLEVLVDTEVTINHAAVAAATGSYPSGVGYPWLMQYGGVTDDHLLYQHDLGYIPHVFTLYGTTILIPGFPTQTESDRRMRNVTVYATTTQIRLFEWTVRTPNILAAVSRTYRILVFKQPPAPSNNHLIDWDPTTNILKMAGNRFSSDRRYLQVAPGGSPWALSNGRNVDLKRGAVRIANPDGTVWDTVPDGWEAKLVPPGNGGGNLYYDGSFTPDAAINVQAP